MKELLSIRNLILSLIAFLLLSCQDEDSGKAIRLRNHSESGCKKIETAYGTSQTERRQAKKMFGNEATERVSLKGNEKGMLNVLHENAIFTCEAIFTNSVEVSKATIIVNEDAPASTNCICLYDLTSEIGPLENKTYTLIIKNNNAVICSHQFKYSDNLDESFNITRNE